MIVIATIHQPSVETFSLFNEVLFLADGKTCYSGSPDGLDRFFERWGHPIGRFVRISQRYPPLLTYPQTNPADHAMNFLNDDFGTPKSSAKGMRDFFLSEGRTHTPVSQQTKERSQALSDNREGHGKAGLVGTIFWNTVVLCERTAIDYSRNLLAYGIRIGMYAGVFQVSHRHHFTAHTHRTWLIGMGFMLA